MTEKPTKIILLCPVENPASLSAFVETCLLEGVELIAVFGDGCEAVHDLIDDIIVGDGSKDGRFIATTWHEDEALSDVIEFVQTFGEHEASIRKVRL